MVFVFTKWLKIAVKKHILFTAYGMREEKIDE